MMITAPLDFNGPLDELYERYASQLLLSYDAVHKFHRDFRAYYLTDPDPLYLPRYVTGLERGKSIRTASGSRLHGTDNAPAWWIHYQLYTGQSRQFLSFPALLEAVPCHMFHIHLPEQVSQAGWHVAHIYDAKDRNLDYPHWDRAELLRRTARNIHPCNYFYIPKTDWQRHGGDPRVIDFFYEKFADLYAPIWSEFLELVGGVPREVRTGSEDIEYSFSNKISDPYRPQANPANVQSGCVVTYSYPRLCFKADLIEPLDMDDKFCVVTPEGTFAMSKREFYATFKGVVASKSYQVNRVYHFPRIPERALRFKVNGE
jgi:hypothetical protein